MIGTDSWLVAMTPGDSRSDSAPLVLGILAAPVEAIGRPPRLDWAQVGIGETNRPWRGYWKRWANLGLILDASRRAFGHVAFPWISQNISQVGVQGARTAKFC